MPSWRKTTITIDVSNSGKKFIANGEVLKFDGFLKVYLESTDDEEEEGTTGILPPVKVGEELSMNEINATEKFTKHPPRYTEASLVKKLEELGIGRPLNICSHDQYYSEAYICGQGKQGRE